MGDHVVLCVEPKKPLNSIQNNSSSSAVMVFHNKSIQHSCGDESSSLANGSASMSGVVGDSDSDSLLSVECRICQDEDFRVNMETPCACSGSLKYAHRKCVQRWCNEKRSTMCEICLQQYKHGYTIPPLPRDDDNNTPFDVRTSWAVSEEQPHLQDTRLFAMVAPERRYWEPEYDEYASTNQASSSCFRSVALLIMSILFLRNALALNSARDENSLTALLFLILRAAGFLLPCYLMALAMLAIQNRRQRQGSVLMAAERNNHIPEMFRGVNTEHHINMA